MKPSKKQRIRDLEHETQQLKRHQVTMQKMWDGMGPYILAIQILNVELHRRPELLASMKPLLQPLGLLIPGVDASTPLPLNGRPQLLPEWSARALNDH